MTTLTTLLQLLLIPLAVETPDEALYDLTHIATIPSPEVDGHRLQACSVEISGNEALISYNMQGEIYKGGVDIFNVKDISASTQISRYLFSDAKVNHAAFMSGGTIACALTCGDPIFDCHAAVLTIDTVTNKQTALPLQSNACTHCFVDGNHKVFAVDAPVGGLHYIERKGGRLTSEKLIKRASLSFKDARWSTKRGNDFYVLQGMPGTLSKVHFKDSTLTLVDTILVDGVDVPEGKSSFAVEGDLAFIAAGQKGIQIVDLKTGAPNLSIPIHKLPDIDAEDQITNAVALEGKLLLAANGGAGISLYESNKRFKDLDSTKELTLTDAGTFIIGGNASANHIAYKGGYLLVSSGKQGTKIIEVKKKASPPKKRGKRHSLETMESPE